MAGRERLLAAAVALATGLVGFTIGRTSAEEPDPRPRAVVERLKVEAPSVTVSSGATDSPRGAPDSLEHRTVPRLGARAAVTSTRARTESEGAPSVRVRTAESSRRRVRLGDVDLTGVGYDRGDPAAPVVLVDFSDFGCPFCAQFARETYPAIDREYVQTGKVFLKYVPFLAGFPRGREATRAAECAGEQGKFWEMADALYARPSTWQKSSDPLMTLRAMASGVGVDTTAYWACYATNAPDRRVRRATDIARRMHVRVTPSFVLDGRAIEGALPLTEWRRLLDVALLIKEARRETP